MAPEPARSSRLIAVLRGLLRIGSAAMHRCGHGFRAIWKWANGNRPLALAAVGGVVVVVTTVTLFSALIVHRKEITASDVIKDAFKELDAGNFADARSIAELAEHLGNLPAEEQGSPAFIAGASLMYEAEHMWDARDQQRFHMVAAKHLENARDRGFPPDRSSEGHFLLGKCLAAAGRYAQAIPPLQEVAKQHSPLAIEAEQLLATCYLRDIPSQPLAALKHIQKYLTYSHLSPLKRDKAKLLEAEVMLSLADFAACSKLLGEVKPGSETRDDHLLLRGRLALEEAGKLRQEAQKSHDAAKFEEARKLCLQAVDLFRQGQGRGADVNANASDAAYLLGVALRHSGNLRAAHDQFARTRRVYAESAEAFPASLDEAEVLAEQGQLESATVAFQLAAGLAASPNLPSKHGTSREDVERRFLTAYKQLLAAQRYDLAVKLAGSLSNILPEDQAAKLKAETYVAWGDHLAVEAEHSPKPSKSAGELVIREKYRDAGRAYTRLAELCIATRQYPDYLWESAANLSRGHDFKAAVPMYQSYLENEAKRQRPLALVGLGEAQLSLNHVDLAITAFEECIRQYPKDPASYRARRLCSAAYIEKRDLAKAKKLLSDNLHHESLAPQSDEWRDSLFALGQLEFDEAMAANKRSQLAAGDAESQKKAHAESDHSNELLRESVRHLGEAVERYPTLPRSFQARYSIAQARRQLAAANRKKLLSEPIETRRSALERQAREELAQSEATYRQLIDDLNRRSETTPLNAVEKGILRNSYFARGAVLFDLADYAEAIRAYSNATNRYQHDPAAVEAYVQISTCYRRLNKPVEARGIIEQAKIVLEHIKEDSKFTDTTRFKKEEWTALLDWLSSL